MQIIKKRPLELEGTEAKPSRFIVKEGQAQVTCLRSHS